MIGQRLPAEWESLDAIVLVWPLRDMNLNCIFEDLVQLYEALVSIVCDYADVLIALPETEIDSVRARLELMAIPLDYVHFYPVTQATLSSSCWVRNIGPIVVKTAEDFKFLDFVQNLDDENNGLACVNRIGAPLQLQNAFPKAKYESHNLMLKGSSISVDGRGTLLIKNICVSNKKKNIDSAEGVLIDRLKYLFGVSKVNFLECGSAGAVYNYLDDLVRFCPNDTIVYTCCDDESDELYDDLKKMEAELINLTNSVGSHYRLFSLPWPGVMLNDKNERLPLSYASFLVVNDAILVPTYNVLSDEDALEVMFQAFPEHQIMGVPCDALLECGGSLHRLAVQLPAGIFSV